MTDKKTRTLDDAVPQSEWPQHGDEFTVVAESGIFKNGKLIKKGQSVKVGEHLSPQAAANHVKAGDIEEASNASKG